MIIVIPILAGAGLATIAVVVALARADRGEPAVVVTVPHVADEPAAVAQMARPRPALPSPDDPISLARELQRELKRVGCYDGPVNGRWTAPARAAMKAFTTRVNAKLPTDKPDGALLSLVQGTRDTVCVEGCPAGELLQRDGRCLPDAAVASDAPQVTTSSITREAPDPAGAGWTPSAAVAPAIVPPIAGRTALASPRAPADPGQPPATDRPPSGASQAAVGTAPVGTVPVGTVPVGTVPVGTVPPLESADGTPPAPKAAAERRTRKTARSTTSRPPKFVRSLMRDVERALAPLGF